MTTMALPEVVDVVVVGGGMGGLSAAVCAAAGGKRVLLLERDAELGGKVGAATVDGVTFDTGPSVITLPDVIDGVLGRAGLSIGDGPEHALQLVRPTPAFRYRFADNVADAVVVDVFVDAAETIASVGRSLGAQAARELTDFLAYARAIWDVSKADFVFGAAPSMVDLLRLGMSRPFDMLKVDPLSSMRGAIERRVTSPALRQLLLRYATYNGSDPLTAPATLNCIAWVELGLGGFGIKGGLSRLRDVLADACTRVGVDVRCGVAVTGLVHDGDRVVGVRVGDTVVKAAAVVVNADVAHLREDLLPSVDRVLPRPQTLSMSGATMVLKARRRRGAGGRVAHEVLFADDYAAEFDDIFRRRRGPQTPTVYVCAQELAHERTGWPDHEPLFVMVNLPALADGVVDDGAAILQTARQRLLQAGMIDVDDAADSAVVWQRSSTGLAERFAGSRGSLYGAASNDRRSAFSRAPNAVKQRPGLYLASGTAHPGGGVPLCVQSGVLAAEALLSSSSSD
jgi:phytoene desaturase